MATEAARNCEDLTVTLHHRSGERQVCRIPTSEPADVEPEPWTPEFAERLPITMARGGPELRGSDRHAASSFG